MRLNANYVAAKLNQKSWSFSSDGQRRVSRLIGGVSAAEL
jgi:hypothetical protein